MGNGVIGDVDRHCGVEGGELEIVMEMRVEDSYVAVADNPLGMGEKRGEIDKVDDADGTVATTSAEDGFHIAVVDGPLEVGRPLGVGTSELVVGGIEIGGK